MRIASLALAAALMAFSATAQTKVDSGPISPARLSADVKALASSELAGRAPGGPGEAGTLAYIERQFKAAGLKPAGDNGGWTQAVPLIRFQVDPAATRFALTSGGKTRDLAETKDVMIWSQRPVSRVRVENAPLVFVGYGVTAPERKWDDFKGVDLKGKIAVVLINDPDFEALPGEPVAGKFGGKAATYYGRWIYKFEEAAHKGALGVLIVHETAGAAYGFDTFDEKAAERLRELSSSLEGLAQKIDDGLAARGRSIEQTLARNLDHPTLEPLRRWFETHMPGALGTPDA